MAKLFNRAKMDTTTTGSGTITLGSAVEGYQSFADAGVADSDVVQYVIEDGTSWEIGTGTYSATGTSLTRTPSESSNSGAAISLTGAAEVFISAIHSDFEKLQNAGTTKVEATSTGATVTGDLAVTGTVDGRDIASDGSKLDGIESGATADQTASEILTAIKTVDGSGSGLDADTLDGVQLSGIVQRDYQDTNRNLNLVTNSTDSQGGVVQKSSDGDFIFQVYGDGSQYGFLQADWGNWDLKKAINGQLQVRVSGTDYTVWHQGNDGSGSGLDADTLDGSHASAFASASHDHNRLIAIDDRDMKPNTSGVGSGVKGIKAFFSSYGGMTGSANTDYQDVLVLDTYSDTSGGNASAITIDKSDATMRIWSAGQTATSWGTPKKVWTDANDGSGSGLDADKLDGVQGSSFLRSDANDTCSGAITFTNANGIYFNDTNTQLDEGSGNALRIKTNSGYVDVGPMNTSWSHFSTDRGKFYFNKEVRAESVLGIYNQNTYLSSNDLYLDGQIYHYGDTNTYIEFHAADQWRVVAGGVEQLEVNTTRSQFAGHVRLTSGHYFERLSHNSGHLVGSYNSVAANSTKSNPIYTIGSSYNPADSTLSNMYGVGYSHVNASFLPFAGGWGMYVAADGDARVWLSGSSGHVYATGDVRTAASDARLKTNVQEIPDAVEKVKAIRGVTFDWVDDIESEYDFHPMDKHDIGVIAQEVEAVLPELVDEAPFNGNYTEKTGKDHGFRTVRYDRMVALLIEAVKEQQTQIDALTAQVEELKRQ